MSEDSSPSLPDHLQPLLDHQLAFERAHLACLRAAETGDDDTLNHRRAERLHAMRALITARADAGADSAPDRQALKKAATAALANETADTPE
ncbi:hypothetical protein ACFRCG_07140 [Embleya sp. NPDC056575]|uniref:hypothetical protein n=1 Tax=unclassified Embleya TaxID=2699296 RepID=UPI0036830107